MVSMFSYYEEINTLKFIIKEYYYKARYNIEL